MSNIGDHGEINGVSVRLAAITKRIRSFTTLPFVFTSIEEARRLSGAEQNQASYQRVTLMPNADLETVRSRTRAPPAGYRDPDARRIPQAQPDTTGCSRRAPVRRSLRARLGLIVGIVIVAQTLYSSTKDHINEFATLRALGAGAGYIVKVILMQAVLSGLIGYVLGMALSMLAIRAAQDTKLTILMTPQLAGGLFAVTIGMCIFAAISAIIKVVRIDPAVVFSR